MHALLGATSPVNVLGVATLASLLVVAHEWLLADVGTAPGHQLWYLQLVVIAQCALIVETVVLFGAAVPRLKHLVFGLSLTIAPLLYLDALVRVRIDRHLMALGGVLIDMQFAENRKLLDATGVDGGAVIAWVLAMALLVAAGTWADWRMRNWAGCGTRVSRGGLFALFIATISALAGLEGDAGRVVAASSWSAFTRCVPQILGDLAPTPKAKTAFRVRLRPRRTDVAIARAIANVEIPPTPPPGDVFFFVIDSLRADAVDPSTAPTLDALSHEALRADVAVSGGNMTHLGWYALFWADPALYWRMDAEPDAGVGAAPLRIARRRGWRIEMLSSADPSYLNVDLTTLGAGRHLADAVIDVHANPGTVGDHDSEVIRDLLARVGAAHGPTVYLVSLDSVHLPYFWSDAFEPRFLPYADLDHYLRLQRTTAGRDAVKNRYRNSVAFVDSLVAPLFAALREARTYDESTIVVVGDHGEEMWEHGLVGHGSETCSAQTRVALFVKPPLSSRQQGDWSSPKRLASTMDVWPTILDAAGVRGINASVFYGESLARASTHAALVTQPRDLVNPPARFVLDNGQRKVVFELSQPDLPFRDQDLYVVDVLDQNDQPTDKGLSASEYNAVVRGWFASDLERFFVVRW